MSKKPWNNWVPGVLSDSQVKEIAEYGLIKNLKSFYYDIGYSSFDLHLSDSVYQMSNGAIKPCGTRYSHRYLENDSFAKKLITSGDGIYTLKKKNTYVVKLIEELDLLAEIQEAKIFGQATAKSSIGRVDVLARLIVDGMHEYESFNPDGISSGTGEMFLEITPITFDVNIKQGIKLSQLRLFFGHPQESEINSKILFKNTLFNDTDDNSLSVDLEPNLIHGREVVAYKAKQNIEIPIDLWNKPEEKKYSPNEYWELIECCSYKDERRLLIEKESFYILKSFERISLPDSVAVYCKAMDESLGEMRIHYAGFVHPYFGKKRKDKKIGAPLIFEVRGHDVYVNLVHKEVLAKLIFYRMSQNPEYKEEDEDYSNQELTLSKFFKEF